MLAPDVAQERALLCCQILRAATITAWLGPQGIQASRFVGVVPALQRRYGEFARALRSRRTVALGGQLLEGRRQLPVVEIAAGQRADDLAAKYGYLLGMVLGLQAL